MRKQRVVDDRDEPPHEKEARKQSKRPSVAAGFTVRRSGDRGCVGNWGQAAHPLSNLICMSIYPVSICQYSDLVRSMRTEPAATLIRQPDRPSHSARLPTSFSHPRPILPSATPPAITPPPRHPLP